MQFGIFTIGDVTPDPHTGKAPSEHQRIKDTVKIAKHAEQAGFEVFATGQHHNPPFVAPGNPPVLLSHIAAQTHGSRLIHRHHADHHYGSSTTCRRLRIPAALIRWTHGPYAGPGQYRSRLSLVWQRYPSGNCTGGRKLQLAAPLVARNRGQLGRSLPQPITAIHCDTAPVR